MREGAGKLWARFVLGARLSLSLARASFLLRNEGSYLGLLWYLLTPLATFAVILLVKEQAFAGHDVPSYPAYLLVGILAHHFFAHVVAESVTAITSNAGLLRSLRIPREALVVSRVLQGAASHAVEVAAALVIVSAIVVVPGLLVYAAVFALFAAFTLGVGLVSAVLGVYVSDLRPVWAVASQLLFFVTPIFHSPAPGTALERLNVWNPLARFIGAAREGLVDGHVPALETWGVLAGWALASLAVGVAVFEARKRRLAELV